MWKLIDPKERNLIIEGVIQIGRLNKVYKIPKLKKNDLDLLLCIIRLSKKNEKCYIMADWNIDYETSVS